MITILKGAGIFIYPLGLCSVFAVFIIIERLLALRTSRVIPSTVSDPFMLGDFLSLQQQGDDRHSVVGRIVRFLQEHSSDATALKAYTQLEINQIQRGLFILEIVVATAPLLGLLGTVVGLIKVFGDFSPDTGLPHPEVMVEGISMALATTMLGLGIAIPALVGNIYLTRRIETLATQIQVGVGCLVHRLQKQ